MEGIMAKHTEEKYVIRCGCRSVGECGHNNFAWLKALEGCVDDFAAQMKSKLRRKALEGYSGWDDPDWQRAEIIDRLKSHIDKGDMVDVANFAMFAWNKNL
jgi:hypothetical protein